MSNNNENLNSTSQYGPQLDKLRTMGGGAFAIGAVIAGFSYFGSMSKAGGADGISAMQAFFQAYLYAWLFFAGVTFGPIALLLLHNTVGGGWGFVLKRQLTAASQNLPLIAVLFLPLIVGFKYIYPWANIELVHHKEAIHIVEGQKPWMDPNFVILRQVIYFAILGTLAILVNRWTWTMTKENAPDYINKLNHLGPPGLILYVIIITFWSVDLVMTITPAWLSTIIGLLYVVGQGLSSWSLFAVLTHYVAGGKAPLANVPRRYIRDIGNLTLAFTLLWAYMSFSQFLITFSGNTAEEAVWYQERQRGGWQVVGILLVGAHFILPFLALLASDTKTKIGNLAKLGVIIIFMRFVDLYYWTAPHFSDHLDIARLPLAVAMPLAIGGLWIAFWATNMKDKPIVPENDYRLYGQWPLDGHHEPEPEGYEEASDDAMSEAEVAAQHG